MLPLVGRYFGKKGQVLDKYGVNLAAVAYRAMATVSYTASSNPSYK